MGRRPAGRVRGQGAGGRRQARAAALAGGPGAPALAWRRSPIPRGALVGAGAGPSRAPSTSRAPRPLAEASLPLGGAAPGRCPPDEGSWDQLPSSPGLGEGNWTYLCDSRRAGCRGSQGRQAPRSSWWTRPRGNSWFGGLVWGFFSIIILLSPSLLFFLSFAFVRNQTDLKSHFSNLRMELGKRKQRGLPNANISFI